jgi:hypothetical protein
MTRAAVMRNELVNNASPKVPVLYVLFLKANADKVLQLQYLIGVVLFTAQLYAAHQGLGGIGMVQVSV